MIMCFHESVTGIALCPGCLTPPHFLHSVAPESIVPLLELSNSQLYTLAYVSYYFPF